ncbi:hypothetical protein [Hymenobacter sp. B81]|uniref:hypothetical protein n=1 Tax=Hymenobacter sp. B81 TaxID=3344878 RepID=UPI0037DC8CE8
MNMPQHLTELEKAELAEFVRGMETRHLRITRRVWRHHAEFMAIIDAELKRQGLDLETVQKEDDDFREAQIKGFQNED